MATVPAENHKAEFNRYVPTAVPNGSRPAIIDAPIMIGMALLGFVVMFAVMLMFTTLVQVSLVESLTYIPTFYEYADDGTRLGEPDYAALNLTVTSLAPAGGSGQNMTVQELLEEQYSLRLARSTLMSDAAGSYDQGNTNGSYGGVSDMNERLNDIQTELNAAGWYDVDATRVAVYTEFRNVCAVILLFAAGAGLVGYFFAGSGLGILKQERTFGTFKKAAMGLILIFLLPEIWDPIALGMTDLSLLLLSHPDGDPQMVVNDMMCKLGAAASCLANPLETLNPVKWFEVMAGPNSPDTMGFLIGLILPFFKLQPSLVASLALYIASEMRIVITVMALVSFPVWCVVGLVPEKYVRDIPGQIKYVLLGTLLAPIVTGIMLNVGWAVLMSEPRDPIKEWIIALGIFTLTTAWIGACIPLLGRLQSVSGAITGAVMTTAVMTQSLASTMGTGALKGVREGRGMKDIGTGMLMAGGASIVGALPTDINARESGGVGMSDARTASAAGRLYGTDNGKMPESFSDVREAWMHDPKRTGNDDNAADIAESASKSKDRAQD